MEAFIMRQLGKTTAVVVADSEEEAIKKVAKARGVAKESVKKGTFCALKRVPLII